MTSSSSTSVRRIVRGINRRRRAFAETRDSPAAVAAKKRLADIDALAQEHKGSLVRDERINEHLTGFVQSARMTGGRVLEIGGRMHPRGHIFEQIAPGKFTYLNLDLEHSDESTVVGDITNCPEIETASYDIVISVDVFEHIDRPWLAASEMTRILKPGGLSYQSTIFSWRYHPCPIDYWRYTPDALEFLFSGLETLEKGFDATERRRDVRKKAKADSMPFDALGGFRENIRVFHAGIKKP